MRVVILFLFIVGCTSKYGDSDPYIIENSGIANEQQIPKALMNQLDDELKEEFKSSSPLFSFVPLKVGFVAAQADVLKKPHMIFSFPKGGGEIDLRDAVVGEGSFFLYFPANQFNKDAELLHAYYISNSPQIQIGSEKFGLGCGKWNDLKDQFTKLQSKDYLKLNTTDLRYLRVVAGTYVFVFKQFKNVFLTQLTLTDSRHGEELCQQETKNET